MPETKPQLLNVEKGLSPEILQTKVVFEKFIETRMGNLEANKIFENGDLYKIYLGSSQSIKSESVQWNKIGTVSEKGLSELKSLSENKLGDYASGIPHKIDPNPVEAVNWYFYFDEPIFFQSQLRRFYPTPRLVKKLNSSIEDNFNPAY